MNNTQTLLLAQDAPTLEQYPARIEALEVAAFDTSANIADLQAQAGEHEEDAATEAAGESNADKRKLRRAEILSTDEIYHALRAEIQAQERIKMQLTERAARLRREYRLTLLNLEINALRMRA